MYTIKRCFAVGTPTVEGAVTKTKFNLVIGIDSDTKNICNYEDTKMGEVESNSATDAPDAIIEKATIAAGAYLAANYNTPAE